MELSEIKGLGQKRITALKKAGFFTPEDLIFYFPKKYLDTNSLSSFSKVRTGEDALFFGRLVGLPVRKSVRRGLFFVRAEFEISDGAKISCVWFNNRYIASSIKPNTDYFIGGKVKRMGSRVDVSAPQLYDGSFSGIVPIYPAVGGLSPSLIRSIIGDILDKVSVRGFISKQLGEQFGILPLSETVKTLHKPTSILDIDRARRSVALEMLGCELSAFFICKDSASGGRVFDYEPKPKELENLIKNHLPFELTASQMSTINDIISSLLGARRMNRLLQGDVGSGKTVVALVAMYFAYLNGYQSVLMAPTEILARQHFETANRLFQSLGVNICLLTGNQSKVERQDKLFSIRCGQCDFVIGTHAVIQDDVEFSRLSLVVTDEQQRFGVEQRGKLENKSRGTDTLTLTATPIPRTLALILYGELDHSSIERISTKKATILTRLVPPQKLEDMYTYIANKAKVGEKTYIVCPRILDDDDDSLYSVNQVYDLLKADERIAPHLALLHGQMKEEEKNAIMEHFYSGKAKVLISTTVIEVGIDVADATTIVIFNPERYGLSQLHQLRGRVGRGEKDSYCFLVADSEAQLSESINFFLNCNDGFELAEQDFRSRGAGDFLGIKQHGGTKLLNYTINTEMIMKAKELAEALLSDNKIKAELLTTTQRLSIIKNLVLN